MRRIEHLILDIRSSTSNKSISKISQQDMVNYLNRAQDAVQSIAMLVDNGARMLYGTYRTSIVQNQESYALPSNIYSSNAISAVRMSLGSNQFFSIDRITDKDRQRSYGYTLIGNNIFLSPAPMWNAQNILEITYQRKINRLGIRSGSVQGYVSETGVITLNAGYSSDIGTYDDFFCVVDSDGTIVNENLPIISFNAGSLTTLQGLTIANGNYIVCGKYATTHSELPDFCESFLLSFVERKIQAIESSSDVSTAGAFTQEEAQIIRDLFSTTSKDAIYPPITNTDYLCL